jgi:hypothetical protein
MMKDWKMDYRTADIQDGEVHKIREQNFPWHVMSAKYCIFRPLNLYLLSS